MMRDTMKVTPERAAQWGVPTPHASTEDMVDAVERAQQEARDATERAQDIAAALVDDGTIPVVRLAKMMGISKPTLYAWKRASDERATKRATESNARLREAGALTAPSRAERGAARQRLMDDIKNGANSERAQEELRQMNEELLREDHGTDTRKGAEFYDADGKLRSDRPKRRLPKKPLSEYDTPDAPTTITLSGVITSEDEWQDQQADTDSPAPRRR